MYTSEPDKRTCQIRRHHHASTHAQHTHIHTHTRTYARTHTHTHIPSRGMGTFSLIPSALPFIFLWLGGSGIEKNGGGNDASMHSAMFDSARVRGALRCYDTIDRVEDRAVVFFARSSLWVKSERSRKRQRLCSFIFFNTSPSSGKNLRARSREKKRVELNQTARLVGDIYTDLRVDLAMTGAINVRFFSLDHSTQG